MDDLFERVRTKDDQEKLLSEIDALGTSLYLNKGEGFESLMRAQVRDWVSDYLFQAMTQPGVDKADYLKKLKEEVSKMKEVTLVLSFEPTKRSLEVLSNAVKKEMSVNTLLIIEYDPNIIAGCKIVSNSKYRDYSMRKSFDDAIEAFHTVH